MIRNTALRFALRINFGSNATLFNHNTSEPHAQHQQGRREGNVRNQLISEMGDIPPGEDGLQRFDDLRDSFRLELLKNLFDCFTAKDRGNFVATVVQIRQSICIEAKSMQDRSVKVVGADGTLDCNVAEWIGFTDNLAAFDSASVKPDRVAGW